MPASTQRREPSSIQSYLRFLSDAPKLLPNATINPAARVRHWARTAPSALAIAFEDRRLSWKEVDEAADRYADWLAREGIGAGDPVALLMDNRPEFLFAFTALSRIGAVAGLINTQLGGDALLHALRTSGASLVITGSEHLERVAEVASRLEGFIPDKQIAVQLASEDHAEATRGHRVIDFELADVGRGIAPADATQRNTDLCCYVFTSGTTGLPKAAVIRNQRILGGGFTFGHLMHRCGVGDLIYVTLPLYHSSALFLGWGSALATGSAIGLRRKFSASAFWDDVQRFGAASFLYIGEVCSYLLASPHHPAERAHGLRVAVGNGMRPEIWREFQQRFAIPVVREFYGATEGNAPLLNMSGRTGMLGKRSGGLTVVRCDATTGEPERNARGRCIEVGDGETGLLLGRISRFVRFDGYKDQKATRNKILEGVYRSGDRYFDTGDLVRVHTGGWISFVDRVGDTFRWKGENVSTQEVAALLANAPGVDEVVVYGVEIPGTEGRAGMAAVRGGGKAGGDGEFDPERFAEFASKNLTPYQRPLFLRQLQEPLRTTATFKPRTASYRQEGFDREAIDDPMWVSVDGHYEVLDAERHDAIRRGELVPS